MMPGDRAVHDSRRRIYAVVARIPPGSVATYGQVAELAGVGGHARQVGYALAASAAGGDLPWHRVVNARGEISRRADNASVQVQRRLLEAEGIEFDAAGRIRLQRFQWKARSIQRLPAD